MKKQLVTLLSICIFLAYGTSFSFANSQKLPALNLDISKTSVSGLSSGAFMTSQFYIVNSDIMVGAGIIAGGPYLCSQSWAFEDYVTNAQTACMSPLSEKYGPNTPHLVSITQQLSNAHKIDDIENIKQDRIYIFTGKSDTTVRPMVVEQTKEYFLSLGVPNASIDYRNDVDAGHAIITPFSSDTTCDKTDPPYINDCGFMQSYEIMNYIYGDLTPPSSTLSGKIIEFNQKEFIDSKYTSMSDNAYVYVPKACETESCRLHIVFHGCEQGAKVIKDDYYAHTGYNYIADSNNFVMLYPQVQPSKKKPFNPKGCWDFWGYSSPNKANPDYFTRDAPQIKAVRAMVDRLAQNPDSSVALQNN